MAIYGLQLDQARGRIKVGTSENPRRRIYEQPRERILFIVKGDANTEAVAHAMLAPYRRGTTEVFEVPDVILAALRNLRHLSGLPVEHQHGDATIPGLDF